MANLVDRLTLALYDDGTIECAAENNTMTSCQAAWALGAVTRNGFIEKDGLDGYYKSVNGDRIETIKAFCEGMDCSCAGMTDWISPAQAPYDDDTTVLFGVDGKNGAITCVGRYKKATDSFWLISSNFSTEHAEYKREDILCWMYLPVAIRFKEDNKEKKQHEEVTHT